jgi:hypothetical protein
LLKKHFTDLQYIGDTYCTIKQVLDVIPEANDYYKFAYVRHPYDWLNSMYSHIYNNGLHPDNKLVKQLDFYEQASATAGVNYKFSMQCEILDGGNGALEPVVLETWNLLGCYLASANYNDLNYGSSEPVTIALSIRFDNALQGVDPTTGGCVGQQLGGAVSRALGSITGAGQTGG